MLKVVALPQFNQRTPKPARRSFEPQYIVSALVESCQRFPQTMVERVAFGKADVQFLRPGQSILRTRSQQVAQPASRLVFDRGVLDSDVNQTRTLVHPAIRRHIRSIQQVAPVQVQSGLVRSTG
jgi:hypothetical protein